MAGLLIASKVRMPKLRRGVVARPRLLDRLRAGAGARLTLVSAPAGFGKSTLVVAWLGQTGDEDRSVAWLSLDAVDKESASFWRYVATALQGAVPRVGSRVLELLASSAVSTELVVATLLNELDAVPHEVWLVLDDYHLVQNREIGEAMSFLLERLPGQVHVVIITRSDPDLPLARWRVRGELVEIRAADLRFTVEESTEYLSAVAGLDLAAEDVAVLEDRTEGWVAAIQLAALSLRGRDDVSGFLARFAGDDRYVVDYLVEEVLQHQPDEVRDFLLQSAVLDRLTGPLCDAVTGRADSSQMLMSLERANLFLVALDDQREWYRYHHLFADVLRARLFSEQPDQFRQLHERASQWYESHDLADEAVRHAVAGRNFDRAAHLMELAVPEIRRHRQEAMMHRWLTSLPDEAVRRSPVLSVFYGSMLMVSGDVDSVGRRLDDAENALASVPDGQASPWAVTKELLTLPATIAVYRAAVAQARGDAEGTAGHARRALDLAGPDDHLARAGAAGFLGLAAWASGDISTALDTFAEAVANLHAAGNLVDELSSTVVLADLWLVAGRPAEARQLYLRALQLAESHGGSMARAAADLRVGLSEIDLEAGDLDAAKRHLATAAALGDGAVVTESRYRWFVAMGRVRHVEGDAKEAGELLDQAERLYRPGFFPDVRPVAAIRARMWIAQGKLSEAGDWARERGLSAADDVSYLREFDHLTLVRLLIAQYRTRPIAAIEEAVGLLDRLHDAAEMSGRVGSLVEIRMLEALEQDAQGNRSRALERLAQALAKTPEPEGYARLFLDEGLPMTSLLRDARDRRVPGETRYQKVLRDQAQRLLSIGTSSEPEAFSRPQSAPPSAQSLSDRELQVLRLLDGDLSGPQIARALFVSPNTLSTHTKHIFAKLGVTSRRAAVLRARERGLI